MPLTITFGDNKSDNVAHFVRMDWNEVKIIDRDGARAKSFLIEGR